MPKKVLAKPSNPAPMLSIWFGNFFEPFYSDRGAVRRGIAEVAALGFTSINLDSKPWEDFFARYRGEPASTYVGMQERARQLLLPFDFPDRELIEQALPDSRILIPQRGPRRDLIALAEQNARHLLEELKLASMESEERAGDPVYELGRELGLQRLPRSLVCFDISTTQGTDTVGSCIWFENGRPKRGEYRKFKVKTVEGTDDFASIHEVVRRYFERRIRDEKPLPDLIVIDGGKGQLSAAQMALAEGGITDRPLISLAKRDEEIYVWGRLEPLKLSRRSPALRLLQQARDEAHRFAVTYNRKRRSMRTVTSELLKVPGIGPVKRRQLLQEFGSVQGVRDAGEEAIAKLRGFNPERAKRLLESLAATSPSNPPGSGPAQTYES